VAKHHTKILQLLNKNYAQNGASSVRYTTTAISVELQITGQSQFCGLHTCWMQETIRTDEDLPTGLSDCGTDMPAILRRPRHHTHRESIQVAHSVPC